MRLLLSRHGNTFDPGQPVVWTGSTNDLPLVEKGRQQAAQLSLVLKQCGILPSAVYCGPLSRTRVYAQTVVDDLQLKLNPIVDARLDEIDYGQWTGLTNAEVAERFGPAEQAAWDNHGQWPKNAGWTSSEQTVIAEVQSFCGEMLRQYAGYQTVLCVTSNGRLRYFLSLISAELERRQKDGTFKVKTGNVCAFSHQPAGWELHFWDKQPEVNLLNAVMQVREEAR